jgi:hypothetical protein
MKTLYVVFPLDGTKVGRWSYKNKCGARVYDTIGKARASKAKFGDDSTRIVEIAEDDVMKNHWNATEVKP